VRLRPTTDANAELAGMMLFFLRRREYDAGVDRVGSEGCELRQKEANSFLTEEHARAY
jgi:hypothetical protein